MSVVRWGIIGPGNIANNFADGLKFSKSGKLLAIASKNSQRRKIFGKKYNIDTDLRFKTYEDIINSKNIDAIYISTPHTLHAEWSIKAAKKGKHVLCEKPGAVNFKEGKLVLDQIKNSNVFYMEGFMYRCHPQIEALIKIIEEKKIGEIISIKSTFGFDMKKVIPESRLFRKDLAGGAILDVGLYPISFSRMVAGVSLGKKFINPISLDCKGYIGKTGVDEISHAILKFENNIIAEVSTSIMKDMDNIAIIEGTKGSIELNQPWVPGRDSGPYHTKFIISIQGKKNIVEFKGPEQLFSFEAELASRTILNRNKEVPFPGMQWEDTLGNLKTLDVWRKNIGYILEQDN